MACQDAKPGENAANKMRAFHASCNRFEDRLSAVDAHQRQPAKLIRIALATRNAGDDPHCD